MERWWAWCFALVFVAALCLRPSHGENAVFSSETLINNVVADPHTGRLYIGAVNAIYQLNSDLILESQAKTGPKKDNRQCTPPVNDACEEAVETSNHNKLLLVHGTKDVLVVCGSLFRGICSLRNLSKVDHQLYFSDNKGEKSYVAMVGAAMLGFLTFSEVRPADNLHTKLISTRILQDYRDWVVFDSIIEASAVQANPFVLLYLHDFRFAFKDRGFVYFLFSRTLGVQDTKNFTFISRMCENDHFYYSYTELQLNCSATNKYNKVQAAYVATPGEALARSMTRSSQYGTVSASDKVLFVTFTSDEDPSTSAMCMYPLKAINDKLVQIIGACYSNGGLIDNKPAVYAPYSSKSDELCLNNNQVRTSVSCGAEFLPSPLASKAEFALTAEPSLTHKAHLTAVAVAEEMGHAVAFVGTATGEVLKVHLSAHPEVYGRAAGKVSGDKVNKNLLFDSSLEHLYITTEKKVRLTHSDQETSCHSCIGLKDPYCGWCVLEGKCTRKQDCGRSSELNTWLWSPDGKCVQIQGFNPPNLSCKKTVTSGKYDFYNCAATVRKNQNTPCIACVTSKWGCQWDAQTHSCSDNDNNQVHSSDSCPQFESPEPALIPVGYQIPISFQGRNLDSYMVRSVRAADLLLHKHPNIVVNIICVIISLNCVCVDTERKIDSTLTVILYSCSVGREDCSLCKHADSKYQCVWCAASHSCVYRELCRSPQPAQCPNPEITDISPRYGPLNGRISVTIKGSNMGIKKEDIKKITVAGVDCIHQEDRYSVSTRLSSFQSHKTVKLIILHHKFSNYSNTGDPEPRTVTPERGPAAGGTVITIGGKDLDTATKEDVAVTVGGVPCEVLSFGTEITCKTGRYRGQKVPSDRLTVTVKYGTNTTKDIPGAYQYSENPKVTDYNPKASFICGGRKIVVSGNGFDLIQRAMMKVQPSPDEFSHNSPPEEVRAGVITLGKSSGWRQPCNLNELAVLVPLKWLYKTERRAFRFSSRYRTKFVCLQVKFGHGEWLVGSVYYSRKDDIPLAIIIPAVIIPMLLFIAVSVYCYRRKSQQAEREYEKVKHQLENLEESVRDRCKKEFTDLMIEMEDHTSDLSEGRIPFLDYKTYTDRNFFLPSKDGANDPMITGKLQIPEARRATVAQALNQFSNLLNSKTFLINFIHTLERRPDFNARSRGYFASLLTVALHGKLEYYTDIMRTLLLELMDEHVDSVVYFVNVTLMSLFQDTAGEPLYKLFKALKHQIEKGPVDAKMKKAKYTLNDTGLLGDDVEYSVLVSMNRNTAVCSLPSHVKEKIIDQVYRNLPYSQRPKVESVALEWRPGSTGQILSDLDLTSQKEGRWKRLNTLAHYNVRDNATLVLSRVLHTQSFHQHQDSHEEKNALLEDDNTFHLVRQPDEIDEVKSKRGSMKDKAMTKAITEIYLTRLLSVKGTLQQFVDNFFRSVLCSSSVVPPAVKYFFDFLDEQAQRHDNVDEETLHIWKTNSLPMRFWVNILRNPHFIFDVHVTEVVDASLHVIAQTFMDACTKTEHKLSRESPSNKLLYAKEISTYKKMVDDYYRGIRQMVPVSDQDMNTHLAEVSRQHTDKLNTQVALHQLYQFASKYYDVIIQSLDEDPAAQNKQLTLRLQQVAAALENKVTDL
uniref:Plexin b2a, tandem duplicate 1 n=1 Tax=Oreochromis niloticus TaxID=8128 RepID=A0A669DD70_ORENI